IFEQAPELNALASPPVRWTRERLWLTAKSLAPLMTLMFLLVTEVRFLKGQPLLPGLFGMLLFIPLIVGIVWVVGRIESRSRRTWRRGDEGLRIELLQDAMIRWKHVLAFQLEPAGPQRTFRKLTVEFLNRRYNRPTTWPMILADATQWEPLLGE